LGQRGAARSGCKNSERRAMALAPSLMSCLRSAGALVPRHVILLPGLLGIELVDSSGAKLWIDPEIAVSAEKVAERLSLDPSGEHDAIPGTGVRPTKPIGFVYDPLIEALSQPDFVLHTFLFDYRKSLLAAARELRAFVRRVAPGERVWFVGHSIGGPLAALYPYADSGEVDPDWHQSVAGAVFHGGTLFGTFEPVEALTGTHWFIKVLGLGVKSHEDALRRCMSTWPGLASILPDPQVFDGVEGLYQADRWPRRFAFHQRHLDEAKTIKHLVRESPLFTRPESVPVAQFIATTYHTVSALLPAEQHLELGPRVAPGDDTVPLFTAAPQSVSLLHAGFPHTFMPTDPGVIEATADLVRTGRCRALPVERVTRDAKLPTGPMPPPLEMLLGMSSTIFHDLTSGRTLLRHVEHLFRGQGAGG
jgi:pimeloyl-ACP methyl ester carboxylesterase